MILEITKALAEKKIVTDERLEAGKKILVLEIPYFASNTDWKIDSFLVNGEIFDQPINVSVQCDSANLRGFFEMVADNVDWALKRANRDDFHRIDFKFVYEASSLKHKD